MNIEMFSKKCNSKPNRLTITELFRLASTDLLNIFLDTFTEQMMVTLFSPSPAVVALYDQQGAEDLLLLPLLQL